MKYYKIEDRTADANEFSEQELEEWLEMQYELGWELITVSYGEVSSMHSYGINRYVFKQRHKANENRF